MQKSCQITIFGSSRISFQFLISKIQGSGFSFQFSISKFQGSGTLPWNINGSSSFCKGPRTSKVWKSKAPQGPRTLRLCMSEDLCKNYYSHSYFTVVTFLTKIQNLCYITKKTCQNTTVKKCGWEKPLPSKFLITWPKKFASSRISIPLFLLVRFWILARNGFFYPNFLDSSSF